MPTEAPPSKRPEKYWRWWRSSWMGFMYGPIPVFLIVWLLALYAPFFWFYVIAE